MIEIARVNSVKKRHSYWPLLKLFPRSQEMMIWMLYPDFAKISSKGLWRKWNIL